MTRSKAAEIYRQYFGVSKRTANERVKMVFNNEGEEKAQRFFEGIEGLLNADKLETSLKQQAQKVFYED